ncbi:MAG: tRNA uridine-5-carboxymethylaminomethyl(34) synthesis GTPase MnmE [Pseudomonadota bacterium]
MSDTVVALSSGLVPSGVAVIRISGPTAANAVMALAGALPPARQATLRRLRDPRCGSALDDALVLFFPGPASFTGEDVAELHCHGGVAVVEGVIDALLSVDDVRMATAGEFTQQAFANGKLDLAQVEAVGDLIDASSREQVSQALDQLSGAARDKLNAWRAILAEIRATIEADLDFSDEDDVPGSVLDSVPQRLRDLNLEIRAEIEDKTAERLRSGFRVVLAGGANAGKSTLLNALLERDAAIVTPVPGTTRDRIDAVLDLDGLPIILTDTAGFRTAVDIADEIERIGIGRTQEALREADCIVWLLGGEGSGNHDRNAGSIGRDGDDGSAAIATDVGMIRVRSKVDLDHPLTTQNAPDDAVLRVSGKTGAGLAALKRKIGAVLRTRHELIRTRNSLAVIALDARRRTSLMAASEAIEDATTRSSERHAMIEMVAEDLRRAQRSLGEIVGDVDPEGVLDVVFSRFCIGK